MAQRGVVLSAPAVAGVDVAFPPAALALVGELHRTFDERRRALLAARAARQAELDAGTRTFDFRADTAAIRAGDWRVAAIPADLLRRRVEITGPVDKKMVINALNSGADVFMADFEDATSPTWPNLVEGQLALRGAARHDLTFTDPKTQKAYALNDTVATLLFRPRGLHLPERHVVVDTDQGPAATAGFFVDAAVTLAHNAQALLERKKTPALYMPKLESMEEAAFVDDVLAAIEAALALPRGTVKVTVLIETLPAAFQMDEILHAMKSRIVGLNCGRWDYIFSCIKRRRTDQNFITPDRSLLTMDKGSLRAYSQLLIKTCHRRGAFAMGGMSAFIPVKSDPQKHEAAIAKVRADKEREANDGHDGTWVAHPGLVETARAIFAAKLNAGGRERDNQLDVLRADVDVSAADLLRPVDGARTEAGLRHNIRVGVAYLAAWLDGNGCVPLDNLMEDAATAEIARAQVWQWLRHGVALTDGAVVDAALVRRVVDEETAPLTSPSAARARELFFTLSTRESLDEFLTLPAYDLLTSHPPA